MLPLQHLVLLYKIYWLLFNFSIDHMHSLEHKQYSMNIMLQMNIY